MICICMIWRFIILSATPRTRLLRSEMRGRGAERRSLIMQLRKYHQAAVEISCVMYPPCIRVCGRANIGVACRILDAGYAYCAVSDEKMKFIYSWNTIWVWQGDIKRFLCDQIYVIGYRSVSSRNIGARELFTALWNSPAEITFAFSVLLFHMQSS